jgi:hypothetical protein
VNEALAGEAGEEEAVDSGRQSSRFLYTFKKGGLKTTHSIGDKDRNPGLKWYKAHSSDNGE